MEIECKDTESFANKTNKNAENFADMNERLKQIIEYYGITPHKFSKEIGLSEGTIRKVLSENTSLKSENLQKMAQTFTDINLDWLITGRGEMLFSDPPSASTTSPPPVGPDALKMIADLARENGRLQAEVESLKNSLARVGTRTDAYAPAASG